VLSSLFDSACDASKSLLANVLAGSTPTFQDFITDQYVPYIQTYKRSWKCDLSTLRVHLLPTLGMIKMHMIKRTHVLALQQEWIKQGKAPSTINKYVILLKYIFNLAIRWDIPGITDNPTKSIIQLQVNNKRQRFLSAVETQCLIDSIHHSENILLEPIVLMLLLTGARKREVLDAKWDHIDWLRCIWTIPKTKSGKVRYVPLTVAVKVLLRNRLEITGTNSNYVFANPKTDKPFQSIFYSWDTARKQAGLDDLRMHDLRHSFASFLINGGRTLYEVQQLLGHSNSQMTQRYAHLANETLLEASDVASELISSLKIR